MLTVRQNSHRISHIISPIERIPDFLPCDCLPLLSLCLASIPPKSQVFNKPHHANLQNIHILSADIWITLRASCKALYEYFIRHKPCQLYLEVSSTMIFQRSFGGLGSLPATGSPTTCQMRRASRCVVGSTLQSPRTRGRNLASLCMTGVAWPQKDIL